MPAIASISGCTRDALYKGFINCYQRRFPSAGRKAGFLDWVETAGLVLDGNPFSFQRHEYLKEPYGDPHPCQVEMKAAQLGLTTKAGLRAIHGAITGKYPRGTLYLFPSKTDVTEFSKGRINALVGDNPETIGGWIVAWGQQKQGQAKTPAEGERKTSVAGWA